MDNLILSQTLTSGNGRGKSVLTEAIKGIFAPPKKQAIPQNGNSDIRLVIARIQRNQDKFEKDLDALLAYLESQND